MNDPEHSYPPAEIGTTPNGGGPDYSYSLAAWLTAVELSQRRADRRRARHRRYALILNATVLGLALVAAVVLFLLG